MAGRDHSSGSPALRSPVKYVASYNARIFGTPNHAPGKVFRRTMLKKRSPPSSLRASPSSFGSGAFGFAAEGVCSGEAAAREREGRHGAIRLFEPDDRLVCVRLQQMHSSNEIVVPADAGIARAEANGLLPERDHLISAAASSARRNTLGVKRAGRETLAPITAATCPGELD